MPRYRVKIEERHIGYVEIESFSKKDAERDALFLDCDSEFDAVVDSTVVEVLEE